MLSITRIIKTYRQMRRSRRQQIDLATSFDEGQMVRRSRLELKHVVKRRVRNKAASASRRINRR